MRKVSPKTFSEGVTTLGAAILLASYAAWSLAPDYFNLLETRLVLRVLVARHARSLPLLFGILCIDLFVGFNLFMIGIAVALFLVFVYAGGLAEALRSVSFDEFFSQWRATASDVVPVIWKSNPFASLFWAGMIPSVWLWLYTAASVITRLAARSATVLRFLTWSLDIKDHPLRSVGVVAAVFVSGGYAVGVLVSSLVT